MRTLQGREEIERRGLERNDEYLDLDEPNTLPDCPSPDLGQDCMGCTTPVKKLNIRLERYRKEESMKASVKNNK